MFTNFFYRLREADLDVTLQQWMSFLKALELGLAKNSLLEFYYLARAVLIHSQGDYDKYDKVFLSCFEGIEHFEELPKEFFDWLQEAKEMKPYDKDEVDSRTDFDLQKLRELLEERLKEQHGRHDGGQYWVGTGGTSTHGHSGYAKTGILVGGKGGRGHALQVAGEREYKDFREDETLEIRSFQMAFRQLRQLSILEEGAKTELNLDATIEETSKKAGMLHLAFERPRKNKVKLLLLFDTGGSMRPYAKLCSQLFQAVHQANHFADLRMYYFRNCIYDAVYESPSLYDEESVQTTWLLQQLSREYKVIFVGDAAMAPSELYNVGGCHDYMHFNEEAGIAWLLKLKKRFSNVVWFNPLPEERRGYHYGAPTINAIAGIFPMYHLSAEGLGKGLKKLISGKD